MAHLTITVPEEHVDELRRALLRAHADRAAELRRALDAYLETHERLEDVEGALVELRDLDDALGQLGWAASMPPRHVVLTAHPELIADALRAAVAVAGESAPALAALLAIVDGAAQ
jgi:hypothetical protein